MILFADTVNEICRIFENYKHEGSCPVLNEEAYFAKFLTSERLLTLQISDSNFRRHILVQILTLFQYLTGDVKFKPNKLVSLYCLGNLSLHAVLPNSPNVERVSWTFLHGLHGRGVTVQWSISQKRLCKKS